MHDVSGEKLLSRLRLNFSNLNKHKARDGFKDVSDCMGHYVSSTETTLHFLLQCQKYQTMRLELLNSIHNLDLKTRILSNDKILRILFYGSKSYSFEAKREIIKLTIKFLKSSKRFERPLLWQGMQVNRITFFLNFLFVQHLV